MPRLTLLLLALCLGLAGCMQPNVSIFAQPGAPYREQVLSGQGRDKILLLGVDGLISERGREGFLRSRPSLVEEVAAQLRIARKDPAVKAVVLKVDSPGGTVTASDIVYHELMSFKNERKAPLVAVLMGVAASGGYYVALPADHIAAHPTTITGSVGVIFVQPRVAGLLDKIGVGVDVAKSGAQKDMGSPFRPQTDEERKLTDSLVQAQAARFQMLVREHRKLAPEAMKTVSTARVFTAAEAKELGLVDSVGYMEDALGKARALAGIGSDARVVVYRRQPLPQATYYQPGAEAEEPRMALLNLGLESLLPTQSGLHALWLPGAGQ